MKKAIAVKPGMYTIFYHELKQIAELYGYNLVIHGSMNRDMDLIAIPWTDEPRDEFKMIQEFEKYLCGRLFEKTNRPTVPQRLPGGRNSYTISLNRGNKHGEWIRFEDQEYYLDISVTPLVK